MTTAAAAPLLIEDEKSLVAEASSAHSRINVPLNLDNWKELDEPTTNELLWFHQHLLDNRLSWQDAQEALNYDRSTVFRVLKGTYAGSMAKVIEAIRSYRKITEQRGSIQQNEFVENSISRLIWAGLDYAVANNSITMIVGESRSGKTLAVREWARRNNHGRSVFVTAPPIGGAKSLIRHVASAVGVNKSQALSNIVEAIYRAFNRNRILIVDEAHRCLPSDLRTANPALLEFLRDLHDQTSCALALISTKRLPDRLEKGQYQYEQLLGRIGMPIHIRPIIRKSDVTPIIRQFLDKPSPELVDNLVEVANKPGRLGILVELLKVASRIASKARQSLAEHHILQAIALRAQMTGGQQ